MQYYVRPEGETEPKGPFDVATIADHIRKGWVTRGAVIAKPGDTTWVPLSQVPEFAVALSHVARHRPDLSPGVPSSAPASNASASKPKKELPIGVWLVVIGMLILSTLGIVGLFCGLAFAGYSGFAKYKGLRSPFTPQKEAPIEWSATVGGVALGLVVVMIAGTGIERDHRAAAEVQKQAELKKVAQEEQAAEQEAEVKRRHQNIQSELPSKIKEWERVLTVTDDLRELDTLRETADKYAKKQLPTGATPPILAEFLQMLDEKIAPMRVAAEINDLGTRLMLFRNSASSNVQSRDWRAAEKDLAEAEDLITSLSEHPKVDVKAIHPALDLDQERRTLKALDKAIQPKLEQLRIQEEATRLYREMCGEAPHVDAWDGGNGLLERQLKRVAHDPDSIDVEECTQPVMTDKKCWQMTCTVRGKNAFGAKIRNRQTFHYSKVQGFAE